MLFKFIAIVLALLLMAVVSEAFPEDLESSTYQDYFDLANCDIHSTLFLFIDEFMDSNITYVDQSDEISSPCKISLFSFCIWR